MLSPLAVAPELREAGLGFTEQAGLGTLSSDLVFAWDAHSI